MSDLTQCLCANLRQTSRLVGQRYDGALSSSGLNSHQFTMLANINGAQPISKTKLAKHMGMERTTLVRNVKVLIKHGWVVEQSGEDARERILSLTDAGQETFSEARQSWEGMHKRMFSLVGEDKARALLAQLVEINQLLSD